MSIGTTLAIRLFELIRRGMRINNLVSALNFNQMYSPGVSLQNFKVKALEANLAHLFGHKGET